MTGPPLARLNLPTVSLDWNTRRASTSCRDAPGDLVSAVQTGPSTRLGAAGAFPLFAAISALGVVFIPRLDLETEGRPPRQAFPCLKWGA